MFRLPTVNDDAGNTVVNNQTLAFLADNLRVISETLMKMQKDAAEVKFESEKAQKAAAEAQANNVALQAQLNCQTEKRASGYKFRHLGNELVYFAHIDTMSNISQGLSAMRLGNIDSADNLFTDSHSELIQQNKHVKIAGWNLVQELLGNDMASTADEERKLKRAELACEMRYKRKIEADQKSHAQVKKANDNSVSVVNTPMLSSSANGTQYVQFPVQALAGGAQAFAGQVVKIMPGNTNSDSTAAGNNSGNANGTGYRRREIGPCFKCQGPHLVRNCPELTQRTEDVQGKIEEAYTNTQA
jgi:hypothetical protein